MRDFDPGQAMKRLEGRLALICIAAEIITNEQCQQGFDLSAAIADLARDTAADCYDLSDTYIEYEHRERQERLEADTKLKEAVEAARKEAVSEVEPRIAALEAMTAEAIKAEAAKLNRKRKSAVKPKRKASTKAG